MAQTVTKKDAAVLQKQPPHARTLFVAAEAFFSFVGAGIAGTIWQHDRTGEDLPCTADGGCALVGQSRWSHLDLIVFHHVPVALLGLLGYVLLLSVSMLRLSSDNARLGRALHGLLLLVSGGGAAYSWYLQWIAHAEIGAFCIWCRASAITMTLLFGTALWEQWKAARRTSFD